MANIFALGLLNGMGSQFLKHREEQRELAERKRQEEREERLRQEDRDYVELQSLMDQQRAYELEDFRATQQRDLSLLEAERQDKQLQDLRKMYPNAVIAPQAFSVQIPKDGSATPLLETASEIPNADPRETLFSYRDSKGNMRRFPSFNTDTVKESSERARWIRGAFNTVFDDDELDFHLRNYDKIRNNDPDAPQENVIQKLSQILGTYSEDYEKALTVKQNNKTYIRSPLTFFGLENRRPEVAERFATTVVAPLIGVDAQKIRQIFKIPKNMPMTYDNFSKSYVIDDNMLETHRYAIIPNPDPQSQDKHIYDPDIFSRAREIASYSGRSVYNVISEIGSTKTGAVQSKEQAMKEFDRVSQLKASIGNLPTNEFDLKNVLPSFKKTVYPKIRNLDPDEAIETIRMAIPSDAENVVTAWDVTEGTPKPTYAATTKNLFGVTPAEARFKYSNAENAVATMRAMLELRKQYGVKPGAIGTLRVSAAGVADLLRDGAEFLSNLGAPESEQDARLRQEQIGELNSFASIFEEKGFTEELEAQSLFNMLARQASYYIAGAVQGGATGRAVSDFDVRNNAESMQLQKVFSFGAGADANIEYLLTKMERETALSQRYMNPQSFEDMQAALIYEQVTGGRMTFGSMLSGMDLDETVGPANNPVATDQEAETEDFFGVKINVIP